LPKNKSQNNNNFNYDHSQLHSVTNFFAINWWNINMVRSKFNGKYSYKQHTGAELCLHVVRKWADVIWWNMELPVLH